MSVSVVACAYFFQAWDFGIGNSTLTIKIVIQQEFNGMVHRASKLDMELSESEFRFSKRMLNFFKMLEICTVKDLTTIPLTKFTCFKGFKTKCSEELKAFIEFEQLHDFFKVR